MEPFRYQATPQPVGDHGASANQINEQAIEDYLARLLTAICADFEGLVITPVTPVTPGGDDEDVQFNDGGAFGGEDAFRYNKTTNQVVPGASQLIVDQASLPANPSAGGTVLFGRQLAVSRPWWLNSDGVLEMVQPCGARRTIFTFAPHAIATAAATINLLWHNGYTFAGTGAGGTSFPSRANTNIKTRQPGLFRVTSATANNSLAEFHGTVPFIWRGDSAGAGGFFYACRFGFGAVPATLKFFHGLRVSTAAPLGSVDPTAFTECVGIGCDPGDTTLRILHNDGAGGCTEIDLLANFTISTSALFELFLYAPPNGGNIEYFVLNVGTGSVATGTLSTELPTATSFMVPHYWMTNGGVAGAVACVMDIGRAYIEVFE